VTIQEGWFSDKKKKGTKRHHLCDVAAWDSSACQCQEKKRHPNGKRKKKREVGKRVSVEEREGRKKKKRVSGIC